MHQSSKQALVMRECFCLQLFYEFFAELSLKVFPFFAHKANHKIPYITMYHIKHRTKKPSPCIKLTTAH